ncbi:tetratricopeptide repeat protein [Pontibacter qinzhouensis]|uniref:Tetratricopeptide repeat protein n=1 Tax=Pontibacter qinzhouensis TaxID=2603253 RepID=A0A5C8K8K6_9BACT|nr:tetratricopeptide repeat protein [Pontibacter qinzhouensis]TXK46807.1 tetratricopeptide repeat protein [Pontibacter qinzhouensis]
MPTLFRCCLAACLLLCFFWQPANARDSVTISSPESTEQVNHLTQLANRLYSSHPDSAYALAHQALQLADKLEYELGQANSHQLIGRLLYHQGVYNQSLQNLLQAEKIYLQLQHQDRLGENLNYQGLVYYAIRQPDLSLKHHQEALALYEKQQDQKGIAYSYGSIGRLYEKRQQYALALEYQQRALQLYEQLQDKPGTATILENIGSILEDKEEFEQALQYFSRSVALSKAAGDSLAMIVGLNNIGDIYRKTGRYSHSIETTQHALELATRLSDRYQISSAHKDLSQVYSLLGNYKAAYEHLDIFRRQHNELYNQETTQQIALLQSLFNVEQQNNAIQMLEKQQQLNNLVKIALAAGLLLLVLLGFVVFSRQRLKIRQNKEAMAQQEQMHAAQRKLMEAELENTQLREKQLQHDLQAQVKSLTAHTLHIIGKNQTLDELKTKLNEALQDDQKAQRRKFKSLINQIDYSQVQDREWKDFRGTFEQVHQDFFDKLHLHARDLTSSETRLASLIRLNLPSKEVATILGISQDSLRVARYRLKKKLLLQQEESLSSFILNL